MSIKKILKVLVILLLPILLLLGAYFYFKRTQVPSSNNTFNLTYEASLGGTLTGELNQKIEEFSSGQKVTAVPNAGYKFVEWSDGSTENPRIDTNVVRAISVVANFAKTSFEVTYSVGLNGKIVGEKVQNVEYGDDAKEVEAIPNEGYSFVKWSDGVAANPRLDKSISKEINVSAILISDDAVDTSTNSSSNNKSNENVTGSYILNYSNGGKADKGFIDGPTIQYVAAGADGQQVRALGTSEYVFYEWSDGSTQNPRKDTSISGNIDVTALFRSKVYELTYKANDNGSIQGNSKQQIKHGTDGTEVLAVPDEGYSFNKWSDGSQKNPRIDLEIKSNHTYTADFISNGPFTLTYAAGSNGTISGTSPQIVALGGSGTPITATPSTGYGFSQWSDGSTANPRTDTNVTSDVNVTAQFAANTYSLTYTAGSGGTITGSSSQIVNYGEDGSAVTAVPNTGYSFTLWSDASSDNPRTDTNVMADVSVSATFKINSYVLTYTAGANGTLSGTSPQNVTYGSNGSAITAVADPNYSFTSWSDANTDNPRTDSNVMANVSVGASFAAIDYSFTQLDTELFHSNITTVGEVISLTSTDFVVTYLDENTDVVVKTYSIDGSYNLTSADTYTITTTPGYHPYLTRLDDTHFMLAYYDNANGGYIETYSVDGSLNITQIDSLLHETTLAQLFATMVTIDSTHAILAYGGAGTVGGIIKVFSVDGSYNITEESSLAIDASSTLNYFSLSLIDSTHFALAYNNSTASTSYFKTYSLDGSYSATELDSITFDETRNVGELEIAKINATNYLISYSSLDDSNNYIDSYAIDGSYNISLTDSAALGTTYVFRNSLIQLDTAKFVQQNIATSPALGTLHGILTDTSYNITQADTVNFGSTTTSSDMYTGLAKVDANHFVEIHNDSSRRGVISTYSYSE